MEDQQCTNKVRVFHPAICLMLSIWAACWTISNGIWYFANTYKMLSTLGWKSFTLAISPAFWLWLTLVSASWYAPLSMIFLPWKMIKLTHSRSILALIIILVPVILTLIFGTEYWFPLKTDNGCIYIRMIPFL